MITEDEIQNIIQRVFLLLPDVMSNLIKSQNDLFDMSKKFYSEHPEFKGHEKIVSKIVESVEGHNILENYPDILNNAIPKIRQEISKLESFDMQSDSIPSIDFNKEKGIF